MRVIICGGRSYKPTGDDIDLLYDLKPLISEVVSGMSGKIKVKHGRKTRIPDVKVEDVDRWEARTDIDLENLEKTYHYDEILGADLWAAKWAMDNAIPVKPFPITNEDWKVGRRAGPIRNGKMCRYAEGGGIIAFPGGRGTVNCCRQANDANIIPLWIKMTSDMEPQVSQLVKDYLLFKNVEQQQALDPEVNLSDQAWHAMRKPSSIYMGDA